MTAQALVCLLVAVCCDTAQALVYLLAAVCCDIAQAMVCLLVAVCCDKAQANANLLDSVNIQDYFCLEFSAPLSSQMFYNYNLDRRLCIKNIKPRFYDDEKRQTKKLTSVAQINI